MDIDEHDVQSVNDDEDVNPKTYNMDKIFYEDEIPVEDECLEIDDTIEESDEILSKFTQAPADKLLSPLPDYDDLKTSPHHTISDCGYESQGSPVSLHDFTSLNDPQDDINYLDRKSVV